MNRQGIEGIADHLKVTCYRTPQKGEWYFNHSIDQPTKAASDFTGFIRAILEPDNVYNVYDLADVNIPEGYEFAEFRAPVRGEKFITFTGNRVDTFFDGYTFIDPDPRRIIVKPVKKTRRVLVVEQEIPEDFKVDSVVAVEYDICSPDLNLNYFIEHREVKN